MSLSTLLICGDLENNSPQMFAVSPQLERLELAILKALTE